MNSSESWEQMREQAYRLRRKSTGSDGLPLALPELSGFEKIDGRGEKV